MEVETSDIRQSDVRPRLAFVLRRKIAGSLEPGAWSGMFGFGRFTSLLSVARVTVDRGPLTVDWA